MARTKLNWVKETSTSTGTGTLSLSGSAPTGYRTFAGAGVSNGATFIAIFEGQTTGAKEASHCTFFDGAPDTITRNTLIASSTGSFIDWSGEPIHISMGPEASYVMTGDMGQFWATAVSVASASTVDLGALDSNYASVTGTTTVTAFGTPTPSTAAVYRWLKFAGVLTLTHNATSLILPGSTNITTAAGDTALMVHEGSGNWRCLVYQRASGAALIGTASSPAITREARTSNTTLASGDVGKLIDITSGTFSQTFDAAATLGAGWSIEIRNSGSGIITLDPNGAETIDGATSFKMYSGEHRLVTCNGSAFFSTVLQPFCVKFTATATWDKPPGYRFIGAEPQGGGGGGGSGRRGAASSDKSGGTGGGGGGRGRIVKPIADIGSSETVTVGAGGTGGTAITADSTNGNDGTDGGTSSFGSHVTASGGKKGLGGNTTQINGAAGGSGYGLAAAANDTAGVGFEGAGTGIGTTAKSAAWGGGNSPLQAIGLDAADSGSSGAGGGGGGDGGAENSSNALKQPGAGGKRGTATVGGGGAKGTAHASTPVAGTSGALDGDGGGGGGGAQSAAATAGGNGRDGGGGGGGGPSRNTFNSGAGGNGGDGSVLVWGVV